MKGQVTRSTGSWYTIRLEDGSRVDARLRGKFKLQDKKITNPIAVGDWVKMEYVENDPLIIEIIDRENYVIRVSPKKRGHSHLLAANIDQAILIASFKHPRTSTGFIDRFFVSLEAFRIPGKLIINKSDLLDQREMEEAKGLVEMYSSLGYESVLTSFEQSGFSPDWFEGRLTLLSGHSGTGKSTLINSLIPGAKQDTGEISTFANKGVHVTTFAEMFDLNSTSFIIDTPGIKELGLAEIEKSELSHYFPEMRDLLGTCKFNNCLHVDEPGCAVMSAFEEGKIYLERYKSYLSMLEDEDNRR